MGFKVIDFGVNWKGGWVFRLLSNSKLGHISHCFWDTVTYWLKIINFLCPLSHLAPSIIGDPFWIFGKALRILKLEFLWQSPVKMSWS